VLGGARKKTGGSFRARNYAILKYMTLHQHKKFVRSKEPPVNLRIQPRDYELLADVADYRFLDTQQILALQQGGERNLKRRLATLYQLGYLERPVSKNSYGVAEVSLFIPSAKKELNCWRARSSSEIGLAR